MKDLIAGIIIGFFICALIVAMIEFRQKLRHKMRGNYFDARAPFAIVRVGQPANERSDAQIEKTARRLGRLRDRQWTDNAGASE